MAAEAKARSAAGERQGRLDVIAAEDRTRKHATEDEATGYKKRQRFASRFAPLLKAGDTGAMERTIAAHPGLIGQTMNLRPEQRVAGVEAVQTPDGKTRYAFKIRNARTGTTGPQTANASAEPGDKVVSFSQEEIERGLQPFLPAAPDPTTEQRNVGAFLERNPGATEADYFAQKRSPGVSVFTGDQGDPKAPAIWHPTYGPPSKNHAYQIDPATGSHVLNDAGLPKEIPRPGSPSDPATKTDESAIKVGLAAEGGDVFSGHPIAEE